MDLWCRCFRYAVYCVITLVSTGTHNQSQLPFKGFPLTHQDSRLDKKLWWCKRNQWKNDGHCIKYTKVIFLTDMKFDGRIMRSLTLQDLAIPWNWLLLLSVQLQVSTRYTVYVVMATDVFIIFLSFSSRCLQFICCLIWHEVLTLS